MIYNAGGHRVEVPYELTNEPATKLQKKIDLKSAKNFYENRSIYNSRLLLLSKLLVVPGEMTPFPTNLSMIAKNKHQKSDVV